MDKITDIHKKNGYARLVIEDTTLTIGLRLNSCYPVSQEKKHLIGSVISMGLVWKLEVHLYWSLSEISGHQLIYKQKERFEEIM